MMTVAELNTHAKLYLMKEFGLKMDIPVSINGRLSSTLGRFMYSDLYGSVCIEISKELVLYNSSEKVLDVLNHELIHYALHEKGVPFDDSDYTFITACKERGVVLTGTKKFTRQKHVYQCKDCGIDYLTSKRTRTSSYGCGHCRKTLTYGGRRLA